MASILSILLLFLSLSNLHSTLATENNHITERKSLEIIIGGGNYGPSPSPEMEPQPADCPPPPPPPPCPSPPPPPPCPSPIVQPPPSPPLKPPSPPPKRPSPPPKPPSPPPKRPSPPPKPQAPPGPLVFDSPLLEEAYPVLQRFRNLVTSDPFHILDSWKGPDICGKYKGLQCATFPGTKDKAVAAVSFNGYKLGGKNLRLDSILSQIRTLNVFHANTNFFVGSVPDVSHIKYLFELDLSNNKLSGDFPTNVYRGTNFTFLDIRFNSFKGFVPPEVFNLNVDVLFLNNNNLEQALPQNLGSLTALYLTFANNKFTGSIPSSIGNIKSLLEVLFLNNQLTGCLPYQIGNLKRATVFDVGFNKLTGPIPYSFGCLEKMELLNVARNNFYGTIPEILCEVSSLQNFSASYNYFTQVGPKCRELIKSNVLDVRMNCILDLPNQRSPLACADFFKRKQNCPNGKSFFMVPCGKNPNQLKPDQEARVPKPASYNALAPDRNL